jgi:inosine/xanthosine triphosphate pyrophosphatase family protein
MTPQEKNVLSHRYRALDKLRTYLRSEEAVNRMG